MAKHFYYIYRDPARNTAQRYVGTTTHYTQASGRADWVGAATATASLDMLRTGFEAYRHGLVTGVTGGVLVLLNVDVT